MSGSSSQDSYARTSGDAADDRPDDVMPQADAEDIPIDETAPRASSYFALAVALLAAATLLAVATIGVPGTLVHISGVPAMVTSAVATLLAAGALLALRSALAARRHQI